VTEEEANAGRLDPAGERSDEVDGENCANRKAGGPGAFVSVGVMRAYGVRMAPCLRGSKSAGQRVRRS